LHNLFMINLEDDALLGHGIIVQFYLIYLEICLEVRNELKQCYFFMI
jgi:hypothetical protein